MVVIIKKKVLYCLFKDSKSWIYGESLRHYRLGVYLLLIALTFYKLVINHRLPLYLRRLLDVDLITWWFGVPSVIPVRLTLVWWKLRITVGAGSVVICWVRSTKEQLETLTETIDDQIDCSCWSCASAICMTWFVPLFFCRHIMNCCRMP